MHRSPQQLRLPLRQRDSRPNLCGDNRPVRNPSWIQLLPFPAGLTLFLSVRFEVGVLVHLVPLRRFLHHVGRGAPYGQTPEPDPKRSRRAALGGFDQRSRASVSQILAHNWRVRWGVIRLENDLVKTLLDALSQHPEEKAQLVKNLTKLPEESEEEEQEPPGQETGFSPSAEVRTSP